MSYWKRNWRSLVFVGAFTLALVFDPLNWSAFFVLACVEGQGSPKLLIWASCFFGVGSILFIKWAEHRRRCHFVSDYEDDPYGYGR